MAIIRLKTEISIKSGVSLSRDIEKLIKQKKRVLCKGLGRRPIFLSKYLVIVSKRRDKTRRKQKLFTALELIGKVKKEDITSIKKTHFGISYEFKGITPKGVEVTIHISDELRGNDRMLFLTSTY